MKALAFSKAQIPNYLTYLRLVLVAPIVVLLLVATPHAYYVNLAGAPIDFSVGWLVAAVLFVAASVTDWLDGMLARKNNWVSATGKFLDPIADKVLTTSVFIVLAALGYTPIWLVVILVARDLIVDGTRMVLAGRGTIVPAALYGKLKTICQMVGIVAILFVLRGTQSQIPAYYYFAIQNVLLFGAAVFAVISAWQYIWPNRRVLFGAAGRPAGGDNQEK